MSQSNGDQERPSVFSRWFYSGDRRASPAELPQDDEKPPVEVEYRRRWQPPAWQPPALTAASGR